MKKFDNYRKNLDVLRRSDQQDLQGHDPAGAEEGRGAACKGAP